MKGFLFTLLLLPLLSHAQKSTDALLQAERAFAARAVAEGTVPAFLAFMDTAAIVFEKGKPVNALTSWKKKQPRPGILNWYPAYAEMAGSGDFGYTTGPWTFQPQTIADSITGRGCFFTVWHRTAAGEWRFLLDIGVDSAPPPPTTETVTITEKKERERPTGSAAFIEAEDAFIKQFGKDHRKAYTHYLARTSILIRNQQQPARTAATRQALIASLPADLSFTVEGNGLAPSADLAYIYGTTKAGGVQQNYIHVWRREKTGWKLAAELLQL